MAVAYHPADHRLVVIVASAQLDGRGALPSVVLEVALVFSIGTQQTFDLEGFLLGQEVRDLAK